MTTPFSSPPRMEPKLAPQFPDGFVWGVAAAAPQIEGAATEDGKGESVWDRFAATPGCVRHGDTLAVACDHYHRFDEDFGLMQSLGIKHYRLSLAWPRILPTGHGAINQRGVDFYQRLLDSMQKHGITPWVTMFHWDLPQALETEFGGWRDRRVVEAFARYADTIVKAFGDRVKHWITINEILCFTRLGYGTGQKAPGLRLPEWEVLQTYHHALLCHGHGVRAVREHGGRGAVVGLTDNCGISVPVTETPEDIAAARREFQRDNWLVLEAIHRRGYDPERLREVGPDAVAPAESDFDLISLPTDFLGLNIYTGKFVQAGPEGEPHVVPFPENYPAADPTWLKILPQAMYWGPRFVTELYGVKEIYITENGCGYHDQVASDGEVYDLHRRDLVRNYLGELLRGLRDGHPVKGYFLWSFIDNFEWEDGYDMRFGIVHCDFTTQRRTPKLSARWYARVAAENCLL
jgi:beta-glucosidase